MRVTMQPITRLIMEATMQLITPKGGTEKDITMSFR